MGTIIGLTGLSGSGKSEVARYLEQKENFVVMRLGEYIRKMYINEQYSGTVEDYAEKFRFSSIGEYMLEDLLRYQQAGSVVVVDSIRTVTDYCFFKTHTRSFALVTVVADKSKRMKRLSERKRMGDCADPIQLQGHDFWELCYGIDRLIGLSDKFIVNNWGLKELRFQTESCFSVFE